MLDAKLLLLPRLYALHMPWVHRTLLNMLQRIQYFLSRLVLTASRTSSPSDSFLARGIHIPLELLALLNTSTELAVAHSLKMPKNRSAHTCER